MYKQDAGRSRQPKSVTRAVILEKAYEMYVDRELVHGDERLSVVLESLGYTTGAGYQIWPNQAAFRQDLQAFIAEKIDYDALVAGLEGQVVAGDSDIDDVELILDIGDGIASQLPDLEHFYLSLRFFSMGPDRPAEVTEALLRGYRRIENGLADSLGTLIAGRDRSFVADVEAADLARATVALLEGFALRARVEPSLESVSHRGEHRHPFSFALLALVLQFTNTSVSV